MTQGDEGTWRMSVLDTMLSSLAYAGPAVVAITVLFRDAPRFDAAFWLVGAAVVAVFAVRFTRVLSFRMRASLSIGLILFACLVWLALTGFSLGATSGAVSGIVISVMLLGRRTAFTLLAVTTVAIFAFGLAIDAGLSHPRLTDSDPRIVANWFRMGLSFCVLTAALAFAVDYVVRHVENKYAELSVAYDDLGELHRKLETAKEEERRFIARELHDDLGQALTALKLGLKSGKPTPFSDPIRVVDSLIVKVRELSRSLRPALLDEVGLGPAVSAYLEEQSTVSGLTMELDQQHFQGRLPGGLEIACFRIVQEAVTNTLRHAEAKRLSVRLERAGTTMKLHVEDDGRGFGGAEALDQAAIEGHVGVLGMRERVRTLGGSFWIGSNPGGGTIIDVEIPLEQLRVKSEPGSRRLAPRSRR